MLLKFHPCRIVSFKTVIILLSFYIFILDIFNHWIIMLLRFHPCRIISFKTMITFSSFIFFLRDAVRDNHEQLCNSKYIRYKLISHLREVSRNFLKMIASR